MVEMLISVERRNLCPLKTTIFIICPKCGRKGKLGVKKKNAFGQRKYMIIHEDGKCYVSPLDKEWESLDQLYSSIRKV